jgi:methionine synthase II (cobalamin-independent)
MRMTYESLRYADEVSQETYNLITGASMMYNVLTESYGPEWFTVEEERFIVEFAELINEKIKEMYSNEV